MKSTFRTKVFKVAHEMKKATGKCFAICLLKSWELYRLTKEMKNGVVSFAYEKADGTLRKAKGTLKDVQSLVKGTGKDNYKTVKYFDVEASGFRCFRIDSFITAY